MAAGCSPWPRLLRDDEEASDALQDAFVQVFRALPGFREQCALGTWLHRIVVNAALMRLRRRRRPEEPIEPLLPRFTEEGHQEIPAVAWPESCEELVARAEVRERVRQAIDGLPESYRNVLLLRDIEELDTAEAAAALGISANAVKVRLHRARQALRERLDPGLRQGVT
jgi:RNA polymerase sigma-70 factor (ECF subfamily)